ncbi:carboxymuconolactone decarboxylase family protein [Streptomyces sp. NPDC002688]|uniref:carboxymuconolactone decarboxylase family protein n=1 Tax=Streptomyces sp. NPDC002688 TaxID=3154423 RepID=UPI003319B615
MGPERARRAAPPHPPHPRKRRPAPCASPRCRPSVGHPNSAGSWPDPPRTVPGRVNLFGTLAHHPELAHAWLSLAQILIHEGTLTDRQRELVILRTAHRRGGSFVYDRHRAIAGSCGLDTRETAATAQALGEHPWADGELALLEASDALAAGEPLPQPL